MDRCLAQTNDDAADRGCIGIRQPESANPFLALVDTALAQICMARAEALGCLNWATEAERVVLRAGTALLLDAVARRLAEPAADAGAADAEQRFRLSEMLGGSAHEPFLAIYERGQRLAEGQGLFVGPR